MHIQNEHDSTTSYDVVAEGRTTTVLVENVLIGLVGTKQSAAGERKSMIDSSLNVRRTATTNTSNAVHIYTERT